MKKIFAVLSIVMLIVSPVFAATNSADISSTSGTKSDSNTAVVTGGNGSYTLSTYISYYNNTAVASLTKITGGSPVVIGQVNNGASTGPHYLPDHDYYYLWASVTTVVGYSSASASVSW